MSLRMDDLFAHLDFDWSLDSFVIPLCDSDRCGAIPSDVDLKVWINSRPNKTFQSLPPESVSPVPSTNYLLRRQYIWSNTPLKPTQDVALKWFPQSVVDPHELKIYLNKYCRDLGFSLVVKYNKIMKNGKYRKIQMSCNRGRQYVDQMGQRSRERSSKATIKTTKPTTKEHVCGFYLTVYLRVSDGRCFVKKNQNTCWHHSHHTQVPRSLMREGAESLSNKTLETVEKMLEKNMPTNFVKEFIAIEDDIKLSDGSIEAIRRQVAMNDFEGDSSGEKLVNDLTKKEGTEFVMLTGSFDQAMQQTRVNMTRRKVLAHNKLSAPQKQSVDVDKLGNGASDHVRN
ncbi:hypothetical protein THAOC_18696, partial [Thalassiosira oceanica]